MSVKRRPAFEAIEPHRYYTAKQLARRYQIHIITLYKWSARGVLPRATKLGPNCSRWHGKAILEHEASLAER